MAEPSTAEVVENETTATSSLGSPPWERPVNTDWFIDFRDGVQIDKQPMEVQWYLSVVGVVGDRPRNEWTACLEQLRQGPDTDLAKRGMTLLREKWKEGKGLFLPDESHEVVSNGEPIWWKMLLIAKDKEMRSQVDEVIPVMKDDKMDWKSFNTDGWVPWLWLWDLKEAEKREGVSAGPSSDYFAKYVAGSTRRIQRRCELLLTNLRPCFIKLPPMDLDLVLKVYDIAYHPAFALGNLYDIAIDEFGRRNPLRYTAYSLHAASTFPSEAISGPPPPLANDESQKSNESLESLPDEEALSLQYPDAEEDKNYHSCNIDLVTWKEVIGLAEMQFGEKRY